MEVPDNIIDEFIKRDRTARWLRTYFIGLREANKTAQDVDGFAEPLTDKHRVAMLLETSKVGQLYLNKWERDFLNENTVTDVFTNPQIAVINKLWKRATA